MVLELVLRTMAHDAHSSLSVVLPNAAHRMARALATFWDDAGHPAVEGLDAGKRPPTPDQLAAIRAMDLGALDDIRRDWEVERFLGGLDGNEALEALTFQTTLNVQGLWSGHTEATPKTVTPAEARARLDIRIVPDQEPAAMVDAIRRHLDAPRLRRRRGRAARGRARLVDAAQPPGRADGGGGVGGDRGPAREHRGVDARDGAHAPGLRRAPGPATTLGAGRADCRACTRPTRTSGSRTSSPPRG